MKMRKILFRGKRLHDNKWIYGNFVSDCEGNQHIIEPRFFCEDGHHLQYEDNTDTPVFIIPETVGQFTGLTDKNGKRIFEGDIVHCVSKLDSADMVIIFECGQFRMILAEKYHEYQTNVGYYDINCFANEVIGNIHDNPELLGGENNGINR